MTTKLCRVNRIHTIIAVLIFSFFYLTITTTTAGSKTNQNVYNRFTLNFYETAVKRNPNKNLISSPVSTEILLGLLAHGARDSTQREIFNVINTHDLDLINARFSWLFSRISQNDDGIFRIANKIYLKKGEGYTLNADFKRIAGEKFSSDVENVDFSQRKQTADAINEWVKEKTDNKIKDFVQADTLDPNTVISLINAIYFKGNWKYPFEEKRTREKPFKKNNLESINLKMMFTSDYFRYANVSELDSQIVGLPYKMNNTQLLVILPNKVEGLGELEKKVTNFNIKDLLNKMDERRVVVELPKFKIKTSLNLNGILKELGLTSMFDSNTANLRGILKDTNSGLSITSARQKAFIEVNERGTEAGAVDAFGAAATSGSTIPLFIANHPFMFLLLNLDDIIFCGRYIGV